MTREEALAELGLTSRSEWSAIEAALLRESDALVEGREKLSHREQKEAQQRLLRIRLALFGEFGLSPAFSEIVASTDHGAPKSIAPNPSSETQSDEKSESESAQGERGSADEPPFSVDQEPEQTDDDSSADYGDSTLVSRSSDKKSDVPSFDLDVMGSVGRYQLRERLQADQNATTHLAYDPETRRNVVVKQFLRQVKSDEREELLADLASLSRIDHERVASIVDYFTVGRHLVVVTEVPDGVRLADELHYRDQTGERFAVPKAVELLDQLCDAMSAVNAVTHLGGITPNSVWITGDGRVSIDLTHGHAFRRHGLLGSADDNTGATPYLAPEELNPDEQADRRADQYGIAALIYRLLAEGHFQDLRRPLRDANPLTPEDLSAAVMRALSTNVRKRFASTRDFWKASIRERRRTPISMRILPVAAAAFVITVTVAYLARVHPETRPLHLRSQALARIDETRKFYERSLRPVVDVSSRLAQETGRLDQELERLEGTANLGPYRKSPSQLLAEWNRNAWRYAWKQANDYDYDESSLEHPNTSDMIQTEMRRASNHVLQGDQYFTQHEADKALLSYGNAKIAATEVAKLIGARAKDGSQQNPEDSLLLAFQAGYTELIEGTNSVLQARIDSHKLAEYDKGWTTHGSYGADGERGFTDPYYDDVVERRNYFERAYFPAQDRLADAVEQLTAKPAVFGPGHRFEINRVIREQQRAIERFDSYRGAYMTWVLSVINERRADTEERLKLAMDQCASLQEQDALSMLGENAAKTDTRRWAERQFAFFEACLDRIARLIQRTKRVDLKSATKGINLAASADASSERLPKSLKSLEVALRTINDSDQTIEKQSEWLKHIRSSYRILPKLATDHSALSERQKQARALVLWWRAAERDAPADDAVRIRRYVKRAELVETKQSNVLRNYPTTLSTTVTHSTSLQELSRDLFKRSAQLEQLLQEAADADAQWSDLGVRLVKLKSYAVETALKRIAAIEGLYRDSLAVLNAELKEELESLERNESAYRLAQVELRKEQIPSDDSEKQDRAALVEKQDRLTLLQEEIIKLQSTLDKQRQYISSLEAAKGEFDRYQRLASRAARLADDTSLDGQEFGYVLYASDQLSKVVDRGTRELKKVSGFGSANLLLSRLPPRVNSASPVLSPGAALPPSTGPSLVVNKPAVPHDPWQGQSVERWGIYRPPTQPSYTVRRGLFGQLRLYPNEQVPQYRPIIVAPQYVPAFDRRY